MTAPSADSRVVGGILLHGKDAFAYVGDINPDWLAQPWRGIYSWLYKRHLDGEPVDYIEACTACSGTMVPVGRLTEAYEAAPVALHGLEGLVKQVRAIGVRKACQEAIQEAQNEGDVSDYLGRISEAVDRARIDVAETGNASAIWDEAQRKICAMADGSERPNGVSSGIGPLDTLLGGGGFIPGQLSIIGARPGVGKSSFARQVALAAASSGRPSAVFSLEDGPFTYACRVVADRTGIPLWRLRDGRVDRRELSKVLEVLEEMKTQPIDLVCNPAMSSGRIASYLASRHGGSGRIHLCVVDYVNLLREPGKEPRHQIDHAVKSLVASARSYDCAILLLAQLNRMSELDDRDPRSSDLKESGGLEQEARCILLISRKQDSENAKLILSKNSHGRTGEVLVRYDRETTSFREMEDSDVGREVQQGRGGGSVDEDEQGW